MSNAGDLGKLIKKKITIMDYLPTIAEVIQTEIPWETDGISVLSKTYPDFKGYNRENKRIYYSPYKVNKKRVGYRSYSPVEIKKVFYRELNRKAVIFGADVPYSQTFVNYNEKPEYNFMLGKIVKSFPVSNTEKCQIDWDLIQPTFLKGTVVSDSNNTEDILLAIAIDERIVAITKPAKWRDSDRFFAVMLPEGLFNYKTDRNKIGFYSINKHRSSFALHKISGKRLSLQDQFENLKNIKLRFQPKEFINGVGRWRHDISSMTVDGSRVVVKSTGTDPHFPLPSFQFTPNSSYIIKVDITVPNDTGPQVYYKTMEEPRFTATQSVGVEFKKGRNVIYLKVPGPGLVGPFRLDPGRKRGRYILHDVEIRELPLNPQKASNSKNNNILRVSKESKPKWPK